MAGKQEVMLTRVVADYDAVDSDHNRVNSDVKDNNDNTNNSDKTDDNANYNDKPNDNDKSNDNDNTGDNNDDNTNNNNETTNNDEKNTDNNNDNNNTNNGKATDDNKDNDIKINIDKNDNNIDDDANKKGDEKDGHNDGNKNTSDNNNNKTNADTNDKNTNDKDKTNGNNVGSGELSDDESRIVHRKSTRQVIQEEGAIQVFTPHDFDPSDTDKELEELVKDAIGAKVGARVYRVLGFLAHVIMSVLLITFTPADFHITKVLSLGLTGMFVAYFIHIYILIMDSKEAYRVYSLSGIVPKWTTMPITYRQLIYKYEPIQSISEFSAIGGGIANQMLVTISTIAWITILTQTLHNIWFEKIWLSFTADLVCGGCEKETVNMFKGPNGIDAIILFIGTFGLVMIGIFELDPYSKTLQRGHMTGVYLGFGCPIAFTIQQFFGLIKDGFWAHKFGVSFAITCDIIALVFAIIWTFYFNKKSDELAAHLKANLPQTREDIVKAQKKIRALTIRNVVSESITLLAGSLTMCLWLWNYNSLSPSFTTDPGVLPNGGPWKQYYEFIKDKYDCDDQVNPPIPNPSVSYCSSAPTMAPII